MSDPPLTSRAAAAAAPAAAPPPPPAARFSKLRSVLRRESGLLLFVLTFGALQAVFHRVLTPEPQREAPRPKTVVVLNGEQLAGCLLYTSPSPRDS